MNGENKEKAMFFFFFFEETEKRDKGVVGANRCRSNRQYEEATWNQRGFWYRRGGGAACTDCRMIWKHSSGCCNCCTPNPLLSLLHLHLLFRSTSSPLNSTPLNSLLHNSLCLSVCCTQQTPHRRQIFILGSRILIINKHIYNILQNILIYSSQQQNLKYWYSPNILQVWIRALFRPSGPPSFVPCRILPPPSYSRPPPYRS